MVLRYEKELESLCRTLIDSKGKFGVMVIKQSEIAYYGEDEIALIELLQKKQHLISNQKFLKPSRDFELILKASNKVPFEMNEALLEFCNSLTDIEVEDKRAYIEQKYKGQILKDVPLHLEVRAKVVGVKIINGVEHLELEVQPIPAVDNILVSFDDIIKG